ncbi:uncharacterized protein LOC108155374 [Drosophila miranda]|uniref:uncharacterized protein LOC108155374 n=1 Tax=Drosophila miranda TaxID=7229 RepID=UPI00143F3DBC|nr:uncharacterized protein LOC108155374 [Drosophila miranda]
MLAPVAACLALLAVISQKQMLLQAAPAPFPAIENAAFTSQDLLAEESAAVAWQQEVAPALSHVWHKRHRRHHGDSSSHRHHHHKRHWDHHFAGPSCHHGSHERFGPDHHHGPPQSFDAYPNGFGPFPGFGPPRHDIQQRPFQAELEPFKDNNGDFRPGPSQTRTSSVAPPKAATATSTTTTTVAPPLSSSTEDSTLAIDIRIG